MTVKERVKKEPNGLLAKAYRFAENAHRGQKRKTGEPYFVHVLATAETLYEWRLDEPTVIAGLLHDTIEDTKITEKEISKEFGEEIAFLVAGVTKLGKIKYRGTDAEAKAENLRRMILAISEDLRVVFIKLADRLHNMRTLGALPPAKQKRIALETHEIYAPLAYRMGMQSVSGELQDLAFPYLYPQEYRWLKERMAEEYEDRLKYLDRLKPMVESALNEKGIGKSQIDFRAKRYSSLYKKLLRNQMDLGKIYDLVAMRLILGSVEDCYSALGTIHSLWPPLPGKIKDYIAMPKPNGYRSLHTTVIGPNKRVVEFQIRTEEMHKENEHGIAAHWIYKSHGGENENKKKKIFEEAQWVKQLAKWQTAKNEDGASAEEFIESLKIDFFKDRIFTITPRGEVIDLPAGSTPVDFAYHIHTEIGDSAVGAKVNDQLVPLSHELRSGDLVEILSQKNKKPSEDWLTFVKTSIAKDRIRHALKKKTNALLQKQPTRSELKIVASNRIGLIKDITLIISRSHVNILNLATTNASEKFNTLRISCDVIEKDKIEKLILKLKELKDIKEIGYRLLESQIS
jgi:GTP pyrophosphokinase